MKSSYGLRSSWRSRRASPNSTVTFRRSPTLWASFTTRIAGIEQNVSTLAARIFASEAGNGSASGVSRCPAADLGPCLDTLVVPLLPAPRDPGPADDNRNMRRKLETNPMMQTRAAPLSCASHARKVVQAFPRGSLKEFQNRRKSTKSNARAAARRLELSMPPKPCASEFVAHLKDDGLRYSVAIFFGNDGGAILVRQSKPEESRDVGRRFGLPGACLTNGCAQSSSTMRTLFRPSTYALRPSMWPTENRIVLAAFRLTPASDEHLFTIDPGAYIPHLSLEVLKQIARTGSDEAEEPRDVAV